MADTARSLSALQTLFADNSTGDISPQDLRDFLVSALGEFGQIQNIASTTGVALTTTPAKFTSFDSEGASAGNVTVSHSNDRITVGTAGTYRVVASGTLATHSAGGLVGVAVFLNGVNAWTRTVYVPTTGNSVQFHVETLIEMTAAQYVELYLSAASGTPTVTVGELTFTVQRIK